MILHKSPIWVYNLIIVTSVIIGMVYIYLSLKKDKCEYKKIYLFFIMYVIFAFIFGKLYTFIISGNNSFLKSGLSSYGGLIGVLIASIVYEKIHPEDNKIIKYTALSLPLVYSGTKVACFLAGCCYGIPYNGIFSVTYVDGLNISLFPIQIVETISFLAIFIICNSLKKIKGITYITLIVTILTKLFLDMLRYDHLRILITPNQIVSIVLLVIVIAVYIYNFAKSLKI